MIRKQTIVFAKQCYPVSRRLATKYNQSVGLQEPRVAEARHISQFSAASGHLNILIGPGFGLFVFVTITMSAALYHVSD